MPHMGGPDLKVLFASGHAYEALTNRGDLENGADLIQKPYSSEQLRRRVRRVLDG